jgi:hypothetical protein
MNYWQPGWPGKEKNEMMPLTEDQAARVKAERVAQALRDGGLKASKLVDTHNEPGSIVAVEIELPGGLVLTLYGQGWALYWDGAEAYSNSDLDSLS